jgi:hypothetical protein
MTTVSTLLTRLAYRLSENSSPSDSNEQNRRISYLSEAQRKVMGENYWWFAGGIASFSTQENVEIYSLESDFRDMIEVRVDRKIVQPINNAKIYSGYDYPPLNYEYDTLIDRWWIYGDNELHLLPIPQSAPTTFTLTSLTRTGSVATGTTTAHGLKVNDYITIAGAVETDYNGTFRVTSVTDTTFTYNVENTPTTPATGTITMQQRNCVYRYWRQHTDFTSTTDVTIVPDRYSDIIVAYALARKLSGPIEDERGSMSDAMEEYNSILEDMKKENNRKKFYFKQFVPRSYNDQLL